MISISRPSDYTTIMILQLLLYSTSLVQICT